MTPKLRLSEEDRKALLSWILKVRHPGSLLMSRSTQMMDAPNMQAAVMLACASASGERAAWLYLCR